jgi:hypothetical protein
MLCSTPVAFLIFNRPEQTQVVFEAIRKAQPAQLLVVADGPRADRPGEAALCAKTRAIIDQVDWNCEVLTNFSDVNLGCKHRVSSGLDWVFNTVEAAIILEDDCLPHPTFFQFCQELLDRYWHDQRIMTISGNNFQFGRRRTNDSYYFSRYNHCWGWASWRRAWQFYDIDMKPWTTVKNGNWLKDILQQRDAIANWERRFQAVYDHQIDTWDYQWTFACWIQSGLTILPNVNLVSNIGFGIGASHTNEQSSLANLSIEAMLFPLQHPNFVIRNAQADEFTQKQIFQASLASRFKSKLRKISAELGIL